MTRKDSEVSVKSRNDLSFIVCKATWLQNKRETICLTAVVVIEFGGAFA